MRLRSRIPAAATIGPTVMGSPRPDLLPELAGGRGEQQHEHRERHQCGARLECGVTERNLQTQHNEEQCTAKTRVDGKGREVCATELSRTEDAQREHRMRTGALDK